ncbi:MAG: hypothetical protein IPL97_04175 [Niastella sp.]|nr:hypothetical protein [Niastella sp.]
MKKIFFLIITLIVFNKSNLSAQTLKDSILAINFSHYIDKPIDSLINVLPASYDSIYTRAGSSIFVGAKVVVNYSHADIWVYIYPVSHNYFTPLNAAKQPAHIAWPFTSVRKEKVWKIVVWSLSNMPLREICCGTD